MWNISTRCVITMNRQTRQYVNVPSRMASEIKYLQNRFGGQGVLKIHRGTECNIFQVHTREVKTRNGLVMQLGKGWSEFVKASNLKNEDYIHIDMENWEDMLFRVRVWRDGVEITVSDPHVLIENDGTISDADSSEYVPMSALGDGMPEFEFTFTEHYMKVGRMYVPVEFARRYLADYENETTVDVVGQDKWKAIMYINRDGDGKITSCVIKDGINKMIKGEGIKEGEMVFVAFCRTTSVPDFEIIFT